MLKALKGVNYSKELLKTHKQFSFKVRRMQIWVKGKEKKTMTEVRVECQW